MQRYRALEKIVQFGSFSDAADELGCSQSAVSQMIASLEAELGIKLLNRSRTGASLTIEGLELYPYIEQNLAHHRAVAEKAMEIKGLDSGVIRVGTIAAVSRHWMPQLIAGFQRRYPNVEFIFNQGDYTQIRDMVRTGAVDFGFINPHAVTGLETLALKDGEMLIIVPHDHPLAHRRKVPLKELSGEPYILLEEGYHSEPLEAFKAAGVRPRIRFTVHDDYAITTMVEAGLGISILSELILTRAPENIARLHADPPIMRTIGICYRNRASLPIAAQHFIGYMQSQVKELA